jgi:hypothetical protein
LPDRFAGFEFDLAIWQFDLANGFGKTNSIRHARILEGSVGGKATLVAAALVARREFTVVVLYTK